MPRSYTIIGADKEAIEKIQQETRAAVEEALKAAEAARNEGTGQIKGYLRAILAREGMKPNSSLDGWTLTEPEDPDAGIKKARKTLEKLQGMTPPTLATKENN